MFQTTTFVTQCILVSLFTCKIVRTVYLLISGNYTGTRLYVLVYLIILRQRKSQYFDVIIGIDNTELITGQPYYQYIVSVFSEIR